MDYQGAESALEKARRDLDALLPRNANNAVITVNAGGVGVWIAVTACVVMLAVSIFGAVWMSYTLASQDAQMRELREKDEILQAYISNLGVQKQDKPK